MPKLGWWALSTFVLALVVPIFWLPFTALMLIIINQEGNKNLNTRRGSNQLPAAQADSESFHNAELQRVENLLADFKKDLNAAKEAEEKETTPSTGTTITLNISKTEDGVAVEAPYCEQANAGSRTKEYRDYVEYVLSSPRLYELTPEEYLHHREKAADLIILPPDEWRIRSIKNNFVYVDPNWKFLFAATSEAEWQLYLYTVKNRPELLKVGIAKDVLKRKEKYYGRCVKKWIMPRREAIMAEELFKHSTYGLHSTEPPIHNVGNLQRETVHPEIESLWSDFEESAGFSEVRRIDKDSAVATIEQILQDIRWNLTMDKILLKYGINSFNGDKGSNFRDGIKVQPLMWQLNPYESQKASIKSWSHIEDKEMRDSLYEEQKLEEAEVLAACWNPEFYR